MNDHGHATTWEGCRAGAPCPRRQAEDVMISSYHMRVAYCCPGRRRPLGLVPRASSSSTYTALTPSLIACAATPLAARRIRKPSKAPVGPAVKAVGGAVAPHGAGARRESRGGGGCAVAGVSRRRDAMLSRTRPSTETEVGGWYLREGRIASGLPPETEVDLGPTRN